MARVESVLESAATRERLHVLQKQDVRARSCAALVFAFHAGLRHAPTARSGTVAHVAAPARHTSPFRFAPVVNEPLDEQPTRSAYEILKWVGMIAAVAAPWVLLLTG
jgi:hypothetical protein